MNILWFAVGLIIGSVAVSAITYKPPDGILEIFKDPENEKYYYRFVVDDIDSLKNKKSLRIRVTDKIDS